MSSINEINPNKIWGAHFHMDVAPTEVSKAIVIQQKFIEFLASEQITPSHTEISTPSAGVFKPGYGPHKLHMWEVRLEKERQERVLEDLGVGATWLALNRNGLRAYVHPMTYNAQCLDLETEAEDHERSLWIGGQSELNLDFFYNPPRDPSTGSIKDTRTPNWISSAEQEKIITANSNEARKLAFVNPRKVLVNGFHIHVDFTPEQKEKALAVYALFLKYLEANNLVPTSTTTYEAGKNGPHILAGWEVKFETANPDVMKVVGKAIGWLMLNRMDLPVFIHPVTWKEGDVEAEVKAHQDFGMSLGKQPPLDLGFFTKSENNKMRVENVSRMGNIFLAGDILIGRTMGVALLSQFALSILELLGMVLAKVPTQIVTLTKTVQPLVAWTGLINLYNCIKTWDSIMSDVSNPSFATNFQKIAATVSGTISTVFRTIINLHTLEIIALGQALNPLRHLRSVFALGLTTFDFWDNMNQLSANVGEAKANTRTWLSIAFDITTFAVAALSLIVSLIPGSNALVFAVSILGMASNLTEGMGYFVASQ